jgi:hypothetical protein
MSFQQKYSQMEEKFQRQADADGDVFLPNWRPECPVDIILVGMEPSLGRWAKDGNDARIQVEEGFRNFSFSLEDFVLHYSIKHFFLRKGETYHLTDVSKGAMVVDRAEQDRRGRYERWLSLLKEEINLVAKPGAPIVSIGQPVHKVLSESGVGPLDGTLLHYSSQAVRHRKAIALARPEDFQQFKTKYPVTAEDILDNGKALYASQGKRVHLLARLAHLRSKNSQVTESIRQLMFAYFIRLGEIRIKTDERTGRHNQALQPPAGMSAGTPRGG